MCASRSTGTTGIAVGVTIATQLLVPILPCADDLNGTEATATIKAARRHSDAPANTTQVESQGMADQEFTDSDLKDLDLITRRFRRVMYLINFLIVLMVIQLVGRSLSTEIPKGVEIVGVILMTVGLILLAVFHGYSLRKTRVEDIERIRFLAVHDGLTKVYNLRYMNQSIEQEIQRSERFGHPFCLLYLDVDEFKGVNDTFGHKAGDKVLIQIADTLRNTCRVTDMVGRVASIVGRVGGDEFLVLMPETEEASARDLAVRFIRNIQRLKDGLQQEEEIAFGGISIGVSAYPADGKERPVLVETADAAMYKAKQAGGNRVCSRSGEVVDPLAGSADSDGS